MEEEGSRLELTKLVVFLNGLFFADFETFRLFWFQLVVGNMIGGGHLLSLL